MNTKVPDLRLLAPPDQIISHFIAAMRKGWAMGGMVYPLPNFPGYKHTDYHSAKWRVLDMWSDTPESDISAGQTIIWYDNIPVWRMRYDGWYATDALPVLKAALEQHYRAGNFECGRGPMSYKKDGYIYTNRSGVTDALDFESREEIKTAAGEPRGYHTFSGVLLYHLD